MLWCVHSGARLEYLAREDRPDTANRARRPATQVRPNHVETGLMPAVSTLHSHCPSQT